MPLWNHCAICGKRIKVGEPCLGVEKKNAELDGDSICFDCVKVENINGLDKTVTITDLLARAEAVDARCASLDAVVSEYQEEIIPGFRKLVDKAETRIKKLTDALEREQRRAEKAENVASDLCEDFTDFVTGGIHNAAPYCYSCRPECVNAHGWCNGDNNVCRGFLPKAAVWEED